MIGDLKQFFSGNHVFPFAVFIAIGLCGCGSLRKGGDEIGEGFLSEGGWDPFEDETPSAEPIDLAENSRERIPLRDRLRLRRGNNDDAERIELDPDKVDEVIELVDNVEPDIPSKNSTFSTEAQALQNQFKKGDYKQALVAAKRLRAKSAPGSTDRDVSTFVAAASEYYLGHFSAAQPLLDTHTREFPSSRHRESALYYQASNRVRLRQWRVGGDLLGRFIATYPESLLMEFAMFDRATCHYQLGDYKPCVDLLGRFEQQFVYSKIRDRVLVLKGDALKDSGNVAAAQTAYLEARKAAGELGHDDLEARSLANLIGAAAARGQSQEAVKYYREFFKTHGDSHYATRAAIGGLPAMKAVGDLDTGLANLERELQQMPHSTDASIYKEALDEYSKFYGQKHGAEMLLRQLGNLSSARKGSERLKEQLLIARLEALEKNFPDRSAEIRVFYKQMRSRFKPQDLSTANVIKLAGYISESDPAEAMVWYRHALANGNSLHQAPATLGLAKAQAKAGDDRAAEGNFRKVLETFGSPELSEEATLGIARLSMRKKDWNSAALYWSRYLDNKGWVVARTEATSNLAEAKSNGGVVRKTSKPAGGNLVSATAQAGPVETSLTQAENLAAGGKKSEAYDLLDKLMKQHGSTEGMSKNAARSYRKAELLHEDLGVELGR